MNLRLTLTAAAAVILASVSIYPLIQSGSWFWAGVGAVITVAVAGTVTRLSTLRAAVGGSVITLVAVCPLLLFPDPGLKVLGAAIIAVTAASRPRLRLLQAASCVIVYLAALLIYLNAVFAPRLSTAVIVPTRASVYYLSTLVSQGLGERIYQPPVPSGSGVILLAAAGIGLMAAATDLLAVRLRSPAIAGLPLLALYCVRITTSSREGAVGATVVFSLTLIGYLALLAADGRERLRVWGRLVTVWHGSSAEPAETEAESPDTRALAASGRRIGLAAACIALAFPLLVPGISVHDLLHTEPTGIGQGGAPLTPPNPLIQMQDQLRQSTPRTVLTYQTNAKAPREQYLQVYVLNYDTANENWPLVQPGGPSTSVGSGQLRPAPGVAAGTPQTLSTTKIVLSLGSAGYDSRLGFLPLPYAPEFLNVPPGWVEDDATLMVYAPQPQLSGLQYSVTSRQAIPDAADESADPAAFPAGIEDDYLDFPKGPHGELRKLAEQITAGARTPYQKAEDLQRYFLSGRFTYSLDVTLPNGINGLLDFLYQTKTGFCQQFAFAMAGLARLVGIPSRIAVGYTAGSPGGNGTWKVTTADAHAWPELYFSGLGWMRFEPTPGGAGGTATQPIYGAPPGLGAGPTTPPTSVPGVKPGSKGFRPDLAHLHNPGLSATGGAAGRARSGHNGLSPLIPLLAAVVVVAALLTPAAARSVARRRRMQAAGDAELAHATWREVRDDLADYGLTGRPSESPRATAARVAALLQLDPATSQALGRIVRAEERASYAAAPLPSPTLRADCDAVRRALYQQATWPERWRARMMPASMLAPLRTVLQHALDVFGWMEAAGQRFRGRGFRSGTLSSRVRHQE
jgi:transglutaminase-like putative cysteine protease